MGYDYPECMICYCNDGFNEYTEKKYSICKCCLSSITQLQQRALYYADTLSQNNVKCVKCKQEKDGYIDIPICNIHIEELN